MSMKQVLVITSCIAAINISVCHRETRKHRDFTVKENLLAMETPSVRNCFL